MATKTFSIQVNGSDTKYVVICQDGTSQDALLENLKDCSNCSIKEYDRASVDDLKKIGDIYQCVVAPH